jgi:hypothetical protein
LSSLTRGRLKDAITPSRSNVSSIVTPCIGPRYPQTAQGGRS